MPPDAARVVRQQVDRDRRLRRRRPHAVDVVGRRDQGIEVAGLECAPLDELERAVAFGAGRDLLVGLLLVPVIALPALGPLFFTGWMFAADTNSRA